MADPTTDQYKVWPTKNDRTQFTAVLGAGSRAALEAAYPPTKKKSARKLDPRPKMVECYLFFDDKLAEYFVGTTEVPAVAGDQPLAERLEECFQALRNALQVVVIDLEQGDDAQVIFETLNARGEPLLPVDLVRNDVFLRAARAEESVDALHADHWQQFDDEFWAEQVKQGRLKRPRSDLFLQHFLASRLATDTSLRHLFVQYKDWVKGSPFPTVRDEVKTVVRQAADFRRLVKPAPGDPVHPLATFLDRFEMSTAYPPLLRLADANLPAAGWAAVGAALESYVVRRAVCGLTSKNYNRVFLGLTKALQEGKATPAAVRAYLSGLQGESTHWPKDAAFRAAWHAQNVYRTAKGERLVHILRRLSDSYVTAKTDPVAVTGPLTVEHLMPQNWREHWPLPDGSRGMTKGEVEAAPDHPRAAATARRHAVVQTLGNLTLVTQSLNAALSNGPWPAKKRAIMDAALLPINQRLSPYRKWDEKAIDTRAEELFKRAITIWPGPG